MDLKNYTPFAGMAWESWDSNGDRFVTSLLRLKFKLVKGEVAEEWRLQLLPEQGELFGADVFYDKERMGSLKYESDYIPYKVSADLVVNATAIYPNGEEGTSWSCGVALYDEKMRKLCGSRLRVKAKVEYGVRKPIKEIPIRYEFAKGGVRSQREDESGNLVAHRVDPYNPEGCGKYRHREEDEPCQEQISYADGLTLKEPAGFGFIHRSWKSRSDLAGTYDEEWIANQHPLPPHDFSYLFNQAAHPLLMSKDYIERGSRVELENLTKEEAKIWFTIPEFKLLSRINTQTDSTMEVLRLDTLVVDLDEEEEYIVYASYRAYTKFYDEVELVELMLIEDEE